MNLVAIIAPVGIAEPRRSRLGSSEVGGTAAALDARIVVIADHPIGW
jgi:hypothetical protein